MSAYVVGKETIDKVVFLITEAKDRRDDRHAFGGLAFDGTLIDPVGCVGYEDEIGRKLWQLNVAAVEERYPDTVGNAGRGRPGPVGLTDPMVAAYKYKRPAQIGVFVISTGMPAAALSKVALFKALVCLMYQCSEGDVPETSTFKELRRVRSEVAESIVRDLPAWEKEEWG